MRPWVLLGVLPLLALPAEAQTLGGCAGIYEGYAVPESVVFTLAGPRLETRGPVVVAGLEEAISGVTAGMQIDGLWTRFEQRNQWILNTATDARIGVCHDGGAHGSFDYFAGQILAGAPNDLPDSFSTLDLPGGSYAVFTLTGSADDISAAHALIYRMRLAEAGIVAIDAPDFLVFPPAFSPFDKDSRIEIWVPTGP